MRLTPEREQLGLAPRWVNELLAEIDALREESQWESQWAQDLE